MIYYDKPFVVPGGATIRPVPGSSHNSAVGCTDGRVAYCYNLAGQCWIGWAASVADFFSKSSTISGAYQPAGAVTSAGTLTRIGAELYLLIAAAHPSFATGQRAVWLLRDTSGGKDGSGPWAVVSSFQTPDTHAYGDLGGGDAVTSQIAVTSTGRWIAAGTANIGDYFGGMSKSGVGVFYSDNAGASWAAGFTEQSVAGGTNTARIARNVGLDRAGIWRTSDYINRGSGTPVVLWSSSDGGTTWAGGSAIGAWWVPMLADPTYDYWQVDSLRRMTAFAPPAGDPVLTMPWGSGDQPLTGTVATPAGSTDYATGKDFVMPLTPSAGWSVGAVRIG